MSRTRRQFSAEQKTKIVPEVLQNETTLNQVASKYEIAAKVIISWKKQFLENASLAFEPAKVVQEFKSELAAKEKEIEELQKTLGKTTIERDFAVKKLVSLGSSNDISLVEPELKEISIARQCEMLRVNRSSLYYKPIDKGLEDAYLIVRISEHSEMGYRMLYHQLLDEGFNVGKNKVLKLMRNLGIRSIHPKKKTLTLFIGRVSAPILMKKADIYQG